MFVHLQNSIARTEEMFNKERTVITDKINNANQFVIKNMNDILGSLKTVSNVNSNITDAIRSELKIDFNLFTNKVNLN